MPNHSSVVEQSDASQAPESLDSPAGGFTDPAALSCIDETDETLITMTFQGIGQASRALGVAEATRRIIGECIASRVSDRFALDAVHRGLGVATELLASADVKGNLVVELEALQIDHANVTSSDSLDLARLQAAALIGVIKAIVPLVQVDDPEAETTGQDDRGSGYL